MLRVGRGRPNKRRLQNLLLYSEQFDNAVWLKTNASVGVNALAAPDGLTTADSITHTNASTSLYQTSTSFDASSPLTFSIYAKKFTSNFIRVEIGNLCNCWFNLNTGAVATNTAGSGAILFAAKGIQDVGGGFYRCMISVRTSGVTTTTLSISATDTDSSAASLSSSTYLWGAQLNTGDLLDYTATTSAAVSV